MAEAVTIILTVFVALVLAAVAIYVLGFIVSMIAALFYLPAEEIYEHHPIQALQRTHPIDRFRHRHHGRPLPS
jgi:uncharacterized protein involved in cysteine biosynthesis